MAGPRASVEQLPPLTSLAAVEARAQPIAGRPLAGSGTPWRIRVLHRCPALRSLCVPLAQQRPRPLPQRCIPPSMVTPHSRASLSDARTIPAASHHGRPMSLPSTLQIVRHAGLLGQAVLLLLGTCYGKVQMTLD